MPLKRELGLVDAVGIGLGAIIGAGIFVVTGVAAGAAGPSFLIGLGIAGIAATCNALSSAELAALHPQAGGTYEYGYRELHPLAGFAAGWMFLASKTAAAGVVALGFGGYLSMLLPSISPIAGAVAAVVLLTLVNLLGIRKAGRLNTVIVAVTLTALLAFVALGVSAFDAANLEPFAPHGVRGILESAALLFFAYTGYARIATLGEEVRDPAVTIPRAIVATTVVAIVVYAAVVLVAVGALGAPALASSSSPLLSAAGAFASPVARVAVTIGATTAMLGVLASQILAISRMMFAMARRRDLPATLEHTSRSHGVPDIGIVTSGAIIALTAIAGSIAAVVSAAAFTILLYYAITNIAALRLDASLKRFPRFVSMIGLAACLLLALALDATAIFSGILLLCFGFLFRGIYRRVSRSQWR